ncbi:MAG: hypothetical protein K6356_00530 [Chloroflexus sp.]
MQHRGIISYSMMLCGVLAMIIGFSLLPMPAPSAAAPALQPSPRPTLRPVTILPETTPSPVPMGRVTGTIIDLRTQSPAANIAVQIGNSVVYSDANGNYDRWVESGFYSLALQLSSEQGSPAQPPLEIAVGPGDTVVAHLFFTSPAPNEPIVPSLTIDAPTAEPAPPAMPELPAIIPPKLPLTGVETDAQAVPASNVVRQPIHLPRTASPVPFNAQFWFGLGILLLVSGLTLQFWPSRQRRALTPSDEQLLASLLSVPLRASDDALLQKLLTGERE